MKICYYIIFAFFFLQKSSAQTESYCGMCGDSISYSFSNSVLTLEGHGKMYNNVSKPTPWFSIKDSVKKLVVNDGIEDEEYCDSKIVENEQIVNSSESSFTVKKVKKLKNDVYVIYANRNDSIFKIVSYYDKKNKRGKKLTKGMRFEVSLQSVFGDFEREYKIIQPCNLSMEFHGVAVGMELENGIDDVWFCEELNGPYLTRELQNTTRCEVRKVNTYKKIVEYEVTLPKGTKKNTRSAEFPNSAERKIGNL